MRSSSPDKVEFQPDHLNPSVAELRNPKVELLYNFLDKWLKQTMRTSFGMLTIC